MKWRRWVLVCALIVVGVMIAVSVGGRREPHYNGRSLHAWLRIYYFHADSAEGGQAADAIRHIGTNAIPYLMEDIRYETPGWMGEVWTRANRLPNWFRDGWGVLVNTRDRSSQAVRAFGILGPEAAAAVPDLIRQLDDPYLKDPQSMALAAIGKPAATLLAQAVTNHTNSVCLRSWAVWTLGLMDENASGSVEVLISALKDEPAVASSAASAIRNVGASPEQIVSALTGAVQDDRAAVRVAAIQSLGFLGLQAQPAIPALKSRLTDQDGDVRFEATNALMKIAPGEFR